jgi:hypothetical protein
VSFFIQWSTAPSRQRLRADRLFGSNPSWEVPANPNLHLPLLLPPFWCFIKDPVLSPKKYFVFLFIPGFVSSSLSFS